MAKFTINPIALPYSSDNCYVTIGAFISQSSYSLLSCGLGHLRCLVFISFSLSSGLYIRLSNSSLNLSAYKPLISYHHCHDPYFNMTLDFAETKSNDMNTKTYLPTYLSSVNELLQTMTGWEFKAIPGFCES